MRGAFAFAWSLPPRRSNKESNSPPWLRTDSCSKEVALQSNQPADTLGLMPGASPHPEAALLHSKGLTVEKLGRQGCFEM